MIQFVRCSGVSKSCGLLRDLVANGSCEGDGHWDLLAARLHNAVDSTLPSRSAVRYTAKIGRRRPIVVTSASVCRIASHPTVVADLRRLKRELDCSGWREGLAVVAVL
jgi:hypothetical protein